MCVDVHHVCIRVHMKRLRRAAPTPRRAYAAPTLRCAYTAARCAGVLRRQEATKAWNGLDHVAALFASSWGKGRRL